MHLALVGRMRTPILPILIVPLLAGACARDASPHEPEVVTLAAVAVLPPPPMTPADSAAALARIVAWRDSLEAKFDSASVLRAKEVSELRQDRNAEQIAIARSLGTRASGKAEIQRLAREGRLVALGDSTSSWVLREMDHSDPYVTPDAKAMLVELGRRFHARLDALGLPRYRMKVTSAIRTDDSQADLRRTNANASRVVSAHEFGTTIDISHERFAVPAAVPKGEVEMLEEVGKEHSRVLQAELGRAIQEMRQEGMLKVMMEDAQPVYHMTVAKRF